LRMNMVRLLQRFFSSAGTAQGSIINMDCSIPGRVDTPRPDAQGPQPCMTSPPSTLRSERCQ
jgi:hypothetical protein